MIPLIDRFMANESIKVIVNNNSIRNGVTNDYKLAICEYLWNGFDAESIEKSYMNHLGLIWIPLRNVCHIRILDR